MARRAVRRLKRMHTDVKMGRRIYGKGVYDPLPLRYFLFLPWRWYVGHCGEPWEYSADLEIGNGYQEKGDGERLDRYR